MAKASFPYTAFPIGPRAVQPQGNIAYRPVVTGRLTASNGNWTRFLAIADTGADSCVFPLSLAKFLKLDVSKLSKAMTGGVGSQSNVTYYDQVTIDLGNGISFQALAGFTAGLDALGLGLLGQDGFFENFDVEFSHAAKQFTVKSV